MVLARHDLIIAGLMNALDAIRREVAKSGSLAYIDGVAEQAMKNCDRDRERNEDGYLVVKVSR